MTDLEQSRQKADNSGFSTRRKYAPAIGRDFEVDEVRATESLETARTRNLIARIVLYGTVAALAAAGLYSFWLGSSGPVMGVWAVAGPLLGGICGFYFRMRNDSG